MAAKPRFSLSRLVGIGVVIAVASVLIGSPLMEKRSERRVRKMLLTVQEGLQRYHVDEELYPKKLMSGHELVKLLSGAGFLDKALMNPWSRTAYIDSPEDDWLRYQTNSLAETYELIVYSPGTEEVRIRLDSTENQSLE